MTAYSNHTPYSSAEFVTRLKNVIDRNAMLSHPFYKLWNEGKLTLDILAGYAREYYAHVKAFPVYVSAVHSHCDDIATRQILLDNLIEEEQGNENHPELWLRFAESVGVTRSAVMSTQLLESTLNTVTTLKEITQDQDFRVGVAALYSYESQIPEVALTKREGLQKFYGIDDDKSISFFTVHEEADFFHRKSELDILKKWCTTLESQEKVIRSAEIASLALLEFLDGIYDAFIVGNNEIEEVLEFAAA